MAAITIFLDAILILSLTLLKWPFSSLLLPKWIPNPWTWLISPSHLALFINFQPHLWCRLPVLYAPATLNHLPVSKLSLAFCTCCFPLLGLFSATMLLHLSSLQLLFFFLDSASLTWSSSYLPPNWPRALISLPICSQSTLCLCWGPPASVNQAASPPPSPRGKIVLFYSPLWAVLEAWQGLNKYWLEKWICALNSPLGSSKQPSHKPEIATAGSCLECYNWGRAKASWETLEFSGEYQLLYVAGSVPSFGGLIPRQGQGVAPGHLSSFHNSPGGQACLTGTHLGNSW